jgi:hypothetical protein
LIGSPPSSTSGASSSLADEERVATRSAAWPLAIRAALHCADQLSHGKRDIGAIGGRLQTLAVSGLFGPLIVGHVGVERDLAIRFGARASDRVMAHIAVMFAFSPFNACQSD